ncbi:transcription antitermination factor NusB [Clostridium sp. D2Q-11]|uniref:Transcription antitermination protein NusB n=1 Tax=Anaeromonas frigoriresistens TaxID=2683708 RepID=A0A942V511_9FIRM|nr:transcription antitermination factor NusB [Anaeromonas frigoriresistens]MBS4539987.1 transcription antitermination factor NusB [Anaeromonas frigoriresistens]
MGRRNARESAMKLLYQLELNKSYDEEIIEVFFENEKFNDDEKEYIIDSINTVNENLDIIDQKIEKHIEGWKKDRLSRIDLATLRIAIYEIMYRDDIPTEVSINESIEISKKFSSDEASKFINGVLGSFVRSKDE